MLQRCEKKLTQTDKKDLQCVLCFWVDFIVLHILFSGNILQCKTM